MSLRRGGEKGLRKKGKAGPRKEGKADLRRGGEAGPSGRESGPKRWMRGGPKEGREGGFERGGGRAGLRWRKETGSYKRWEGRREGSEGGREGVVEEKRGREGEGRTEKNKRDSSIYFCLVIVSRDGVISTTNLFIGYLNIFKCRMYNQLKP